MQSETMMEAERKPVPLTDEHAGRRIYAPALFRWALLGAVVAGVVFAWVGYALTGGPLPVAGFGQSAASGEIVAIFVGAGFGVSMGGLLGVVLALFKRL
jgi:hypothetical protein